MNIIALIMAVIMAIVTPFTLSTAHVDTEIEGGIPMKNTVNTIDVATVTNTTTNAAATNQTNVQTIVKEDKTMKNVQTIKRSSILTNEEVVEALKAANIPTHVAEAVPTVFDIATLAKLVKTSNVNKIKNSLRNVGEKRACAIIEALKGRLPEGKMIHLQRPDLHMHKLPKLVLTYNSENGKAALTLDKKGDKSKRFGPLFQKLQQVCMTENPAVLTTVSEIQPDRRDPNKEYAMSTLWEKVVNGGIHTKSAELDILGMGTNAKMNCTSTLADKRATKKVRTWGHCGAREDVPVNIAKYEAYLGLLMPYIKEFLANLLTPRQELIVPEWENVHHGDNVLVEPNGDMITKDTFMVPEFDGMVVVHLTDKLIANTTRSERRALQRAIQKYNGGTLRGPWTKACVIVGFDIHKILHDMGVHAINGRDIDTIAMFGDASTFKAAVGDNGLYEKWEDYCLAFEQMGHRFGTLLENHGLRKSFLPSQQLQAAHGANRKHIEEGARVECEYLNGAVDPAEAAKRYVPRTIARIAQIDPSIMSVWFATEIANNGYNKEREHALAGRTHGNSVTGFCIKDVVAFAQWIAYKAGVRKELPEGCIGKYQVYAPTANYVGEAVISRNPVIANYGLKVVNVVDTVGEYDKYFDQGFDYIMVGIHDDLCKLLRMDHDGDKARLTIAKWFVDAVKSIPTDGVFAEWTGFGKVEKKIPTDENIREFYRSMTSTPTLGLNVDTCGKMIANGVVTSPVHEMVMDYLMNKGTDVKQGADGSNVSGAIGEIWHEMLEANKNAVYSKAQAKGKMLKGREIDSKKVATEYGDSNLDIIAKNVETNTKAVLTFDGKFDYTKLLKKQPRLIPGLCGFGHKNDQTGEWEGAGLFNQLVSRTAAEWKELDGSDAYKTWQEIQEWHKEAALEEMANYAAALNLTEDDVCDAVTTYIFNTLTRAWNAQNTSEAKRAWMIVLARTYIEWFGDTIEDNFLINNALSGYEDVGEGVDLDDELDGFEGF